MVKQIINLSDIITGLVDSIFGKPTRLEKIRVCGMEIPSDYSGSVVDYMTQQEVLKLKRTDSSQVRVTPSISELREQLRQEPIADKSKVFAKPVFRVYVSSTKQTVPYNLNGNGDWR